MDLRSRDRKLSASGTNDVREDILLETNFDEDGVLTMAHTTTPHYQYQSSQYKSKHPNKSHQQQQHQEQQQQQQHQSNNQNPLLQRPGGRRSYYRSDVSIDRYSEYSLHGRRDPGRSIRNKIPFVPIAVHRFVLLSFISIVLFPTRIPA